MPVTHTNKKSKKYFLHLGKTRTGKPKYYFSMKSEGTLVEEIPPGFEIREDINGQVFLQKISSRLVTEEEVAIVSAALARQTKVRYYRIDAAKNFIVIATAGPETEESVERASHFLPRPEIAGYREILRDYMHYTPTMRFLVEDQEKREFVVERFCFRGAIDDWIMIGGPDSLKNLVGKYLDHLGQASFYELF